MAKKLVLITGGINSGKTKYALELANQSNKKTVYVKTGNAEDSRTRELIKACEEGKPLNWLTVAEDKNVDAVLMNIRGLSEMVLIDGLTMLLSKLQEELQNDNKAIQRVEALLEVLKDSEMDAIIITNEAGNGVNANEPAHKLAALLGTVNKIAAQAAVEVYLMIAGIPVKIK